jgi:hypothetical protein
MLANFRDCRLRDALRPRRPCNAKQGLSSAYCTVLLRHENDQAKLATLSSHTSPSNPLGSLSYRNRPTVAPLTGPYIVTNRMRSPTRPVGLQYGPLQASLASCCDQEASRPCVSTKSWCRQSSLQNKHGSLMHLLSTTCKQPCKMLPLTKHGLLKPT